MLFRSALLILTVLLAALPIEPAHAQTGNASAKNTATATLPIVPDRPGRWRVPVAEDDPAKYRCLSAPPKTPLCALANRMTCEAREAYGGVRFCRNAYVHLPEHLHRLWLLGWGEEIWQYRVIGVRVATELDIEIAKMHPFWGNPTPETEARAGDLLVTVHRRFCRWPQLPCPTDILEVTRKGYGDGRDAPVDERAEYALRKESDRWRLVWWPREDAQHFDPDLPEPYGPDEPNMVWPSSQPFSPS